MTGLSSVYDLSMSVFFYYRADVNCIFQWVPMWSSKAPTNKQCKININKIHSFINFVIVPLLKLLCRNCFLWFFWFRSRTASLYFSWRTWCDGSRLFMLFLRSELQEHCTYGWPGCCFTPCRYSLLASTIVSIPSTKE